MAKFKTVITKDFKDVIARCYKSDEKLINQYHVIAPDTVQNCIQHTVDLFENSEGYTMYSMFWGENFAGYFGVQQTDIKTVKGFFLMPFFRGDKWDEVFFNTISYVCGENTYTAVYEKNLRANKFLMRNNCTFVMQLFDDKEGQLFNIYKLCHLEDY